jgi:hypothetical protein
LSDTDRPGFSTVSARMCRPGPIVPVNVSFSLPREYSCRVLSLRTAIRRANVMSADLARFACEKMSRCGNLRSRQQAVTIIQRPVNVIRNNELSCCLVGSALCSFDVLFCRAEIGAVGTGTCCQFNFYAVSVESRSRHCKGRRMLGLCWDC